MSSARVASRYAKSLLELSKVHGKLEEVNNDMKLFHKVCKENYSFVLLLKNPIISHNRKREILHAIFNGKIDDIPMALLEITTRKNREALLPQIAMQFHLQYNHDKKIQEATITTTFPLNEDLRSQFDKIIKEISKGDYVELTEVIEEEIIGGYLLKIGDIQIDDTISSRLKEVKLEFSKKSSFSKT